MLSDRFSFALISQNVFIKRYTIHIDLLYFILNFTKISINSLSMHYSLIANTLSRHGLE